MYICIAREHNYTYVCVYDFKIVHTLVVLFLRLEISFNKTLIQDEFGRKFIDLLIMNLDPCIMYWLEPRDKIIFTFTKTIRV